MAEFTFLELHLDDATITNNAPYSGAQSESQRADTDDEDDSGRSIVRLLAVALGVAAVAAVAGRALSGDEGLVDTDDLS
ncbi:MULTISPECIES: hypothetical protein [Halomicrobium]|uniref:Uncharacterized protein n=1 Tax=Halomicrobium mukohataei TaxID=57705 RepID=A0A847UDU1_9EURY|nr:MULTISPECIES: hypothetical protein [Halomicrobium]NLV10397.1 hypothetical protein [Halomicrobium mukohataei]QGA82482.1 Uncharacterized protein LC1Hm_1434 [Halomicrobium sp. LC1Hm]